MIHLRKGTSMITYEPNKPDQDQELQHLQERINMQDDSQD